MKTLRWFVCPLVLSVLFLNLAGVAQEKPRISLDEFFNAVEFSRVRISPDGNAVVIATDRADWDHNRFRSDLWLYRVDSNALVPLTQSGHDSAPQWSPDGRWIAFLSDRRSAAASGDDDDDKSRGPHRDGDAPSAEKDVDQVYVISTSGG